MRRTLIALQLACASWLVASLALASPASADNCSVFTDCFNQANSAAEAAFGLVFLAGLSLLIDSNPITGMGRGVIEAITGEDLLTGEELAPWERALGVIPFGRVGRTGLGLVDDLVGVGLRHGDDVAGAARRADDVEDLLGSGRHLQTPRNRALIDEYADDATSAARRRAISEELGEQGGVAHLREVTGRGDLDILRPASDADVADLQRRFDEGEAWDHVVAFRGRNATNLVHFDGQTLHIIEAKGGDGTYLSRQSRLNPGARISQDDPDYPLDVAQDMRRSPLQDGRNTIGGIIDAAYTDERVRYVAVRTGTGAALREGAPVTTVDHIFLEPA